MPFLDSIFSSDTSPIIFLVVLITTIAASYFFIRWAFSVDRTLKNQAVQISLLFKIAEKLGVEEDDVDGIKNYHKR